jgi:putative hydrolase
MARMAHAKGVEGLCITDHAPDMPGTANLFYFTNFKVIPRELEGTKIFMGVELNIMNGEGEVDMPNDLLHKLDIAVASTHPPCYHDKIDKETVMNAYQNAMKNPFIDIIGHPDDGRFPIDYATLVKTAKETGTLLELNNSSQREGGFRLNSQENATTMLRFCKELKVPIVLGSDAHMDVDIAAHEMSDKLLELVDFPEALIANTSVEKLRNLMKRYR